MNKSWSTPSDSAMRKFVAAIDKCDPGLLQESIYLGAHGGLKISEAPAVILICSKDLDDHPKAPECLKILLKYGGDPNAFFNAGPLMTLMDNSLNIEMAKMLLKAGAMIRAKESTTPIRDEISRLLFNTIQGHNEQESNRMLDLLIENGVDLSKQPAIENDNSHWLFDAISSGNLYFIKKAISQGADINASTKGYGVLGLAALGGRAEIFDYLVSNGAKPNIKCKNASMYGPFMQSWRNGKTAMRAAEKMASESRGSENKPTKGRRL